MFDEKDICLSSVQYRRIVQNIVFDLLDDFRWFIIVIFKNNISRVQSIGMHLSTEIRQLDKQRYQMNHVMIVKQRDKEKTKLDLRCV
jgi:hypothetical protein